MLSNSDFASEEYLYNFWKNDEQKNIIPLNYGLYPGGFNPVEWIKEIINDLDYTKILEIGCGYERLSQVESSDNYVGVDVSESSIALARENNPSYNYKVVKLIDEYPQDVDLVLLYAVFVHLTDDIVRKILCKLSKKVKYIVIGEILGREWRQEANPPVFAREKEEYIILLKEAGFLLKSEDKKLYQRYASDPLFSNKRNKNMSLLIFERE